ncbi:MAG: hypothetical protein IJI22_00300 [Bacilli bacterium]|nr:hypothetical protein [Bacilli bacterium]
MKIKIQDYIKNLELGIKENKTKDYNCEDILTWINFYQHERLIHLIVTFLTAIGTILFLFGFLYFEKISILILFLITLTLFIFYIIHYYNLENSVQHLYDLYFEIKEKKH